MVSVWDFRVLVVVSSVIRKARSCHCWINCWTRTCKSCDHGWSTMTCFTWVPVVLRHRVGWLVVWLAGWLCESARCKLDNSSNSWDVFIASEDETRIERYSFTISSPPFWKWSPSLVLALIFLSYCSCLNSYTNCNVWNPSKPCKNKENPVKPIETHQVVFPRFPASQPTTWQDPMLFERLLSKIFLVDVSGCNTYRQWDVCLHTNKKSHSFLWNPPVDYCKTLDI